MNKFRANNLDGHLLIMNAKIWDVDKNEAISNDILIEDGVITSIGKLDDLPKDTAFIDAEDCIVFPGLIDIHVHLREPGFEEKETIESGCAAAAAGGFTAIACMPNTMPVIDSQEVVRFIKEKASKQLVSVYPTGSVSKGLKGEELSEVGYMIEAGIKGLTDDGRPVKTAILVRRALEYSKKFGIPVMEHAEECSLTKGASMNESFMSTRLGLNGWPTIAEDIIVARDIKIAEYVGGKLHIQHISSKETVELIRQAKKRGVKVTAEVTPHHLTLTDSAIETYDSNFKMNPPLREEEDVEALIDGLKDGTIDAVAADHAPHEIDSKDCAYDQAAFGVTGLETSVGIFFTEMIGKHGLTLEQFVQLYVVNPRKIINVDVPKIAVGEKAELSIINPEMEWKVSLDKFYSKSDNSCFLGRELKGKAVGVVGNNQVWWKNQKIK